MKIKKNKFNKVELNCLTFSDEVEKNIYIRNKRNIQKAKKVIVIALQRKPNQTEWGLCVNSISRTMNFNLKFALGELLKNQIVKADLQSCKETYQNLVKGENQEIRRDWQYYLYSLTDNPVQNEIQKTSIKKNQNAYSS